MGSTALIATVAFARVSLAQLSVAAYENRAMSVESIAKGCMNELFLWVKRDKEFSASTISTPQGTCDVSTNHPNEDQIELTVSITEQQISKSYYILAELEPFAITQIRTAGN